MAAPLPREIPDTELAAKAARGDTEALSTLYRRHREVVFRFARAMTGSADAAADITQDVFVALTADADRYDAGRAAFTTYLYALVRNHSRTWLRRRRRWMSFQRLALPAPEGDRRPDPFALLQDAELASQVRTALQRIPGRYREVLILCDLHDFSYADAAAVVRTSVAAVRSRLHRGRHLLRLRLRVTRSTSRDDLHPARCVL